MTATNIRLSEKVLPAFHSFWRASRTNEKLFYVLKGGRNSSKSTHISIDMIYELMKLPINMLVLRKVGRTLEDSVFEQLLWAIEHLHVEHLFKINKSPLKITYKPRGNYIIFRGADDPAKIKSIKSSKFPIARLWVEELAEFRTEEEVSTVVNSIIRAELPDGLQYKVYYSYNPPKRKQSWVNKKYETQFIPKNVYIHHSTYLDNPYVSKAFAEEADHVKETKPLRYRWEYLGEAIGSGIVPFDNLTFRDITDEEYKRFDNIKQAVDFGYGPDPLAFVRWHYDKKHNKIYAMNEIYGSKISNRDLANRLKEYGFNRHRVVADSSEPKSIDELRDLNINIIGAKKGPDSVQYGEEWLDDLEEIVIDVKRTPNIAREFESADYATDKDGNPLPRLQDKDNHTIDATRYAFEDDMQKPAKLMIGRA